MLGDREREHLHHSAVGGFEPGAEDIDPHGNVIRRIARHDVFFGLAWAPGNDILFTQDNGNSSQTKCDQRERPALGTVLGHECVIYLGNGDREPL